MKKLLSCMLLMAFAIVETGCTPLERVAYRTAVAAKAFIESEKAQHPECATSKVGVCGLLAQAVSAKDLLIDAGELYCASTTFDEANGTCTPPAKGTPAYNVATDKLKSAISNYNKIFADVKGSL